MGISSDLAWNLEPHVCSICFGRILSRKTQGEQKLYICSNCENQDEGSDASVICACGACLPRKGGSPIKLGLKCQVNDEKRAEFPSLYIATVARDGL